MKGHATATAANGELNREKGTEPNEPEVPTEPTEYAEISERDVRFALDPARGALCLVACRLHLRLNPLAMFVRKSR